MRQIEFDEARHKYFYEGKELKGITSTINEYMGKSFPKGAGGGNTIEHIQVACNEGKAKHSIVQEYIETGVLHEEASDDEVWLIEELKNRFPVTDWTYLAEYKVSNFQTHASSIDILCIKNGTKEVVLIDIKTGLFDREYCSWQLGIYEYFISEFDTFKPVKSLVFCTRDLLVYPIIAKKAFACEELLKRFNKPKRRKRK